MGFMVCGAIATATVEGRGVFGSEGCVGFSVGVGFLVFVVKTLNGFFVGCVRGDALECLTWRLWQSCGESIVKLLNDNNLYGM